MSLADTCRIKPGQARSAAIAWCRSSIFSRLGRRCAFRSEVAVAVMFAAELDAGDVPIARLSKLEKGASTLARASFDELMLVYQVAEKGLAAAPGPLEKEWMTRALSVISTAIKAVRKPSQPVGKPATPPRVAESAWGPAPSSPTPPSLATMTHAERSAALDAMGDAAVDVRVARLEELVAMGMTEKEGITVMRRTGWTSDWLDESASE